MTIGVKHQRDRPVGAGRRRARSTAAAAGVEAGCDLEEVEVGSTARGRNPPRCRWPRGCPRTYLHRRTRWPPALQVESGSADAVAVEAPYTTGWPSQRVQEPVVRCAAGDPLAR